MRDGVLLAEDSPDALIARYRMGVSGVGGGES